MTQCIDHFRERRFSAKPAPMLASARPARRPTGERTLIRAVSRQRLFLKRKRKTKPQARQSLLAAQAGPAGALTVWVRHWGRRHCRHATAKPLRHSPIDPARMTTTASGEPARTVIGHSPGRLDQISFPRHQAKPGQHNAMRFSPLNIRPLSVGHRSHHAPPPGAYGIEHHGKRSRGAQTESPTVWTISSCGRGGLATGNRAGAALLLDATKVIGSPHCSRLAAPSASR